MRTSPKIFNQISILLIISFIIFTLSCSDDPSSPQNGGETPLATKSIGPEGGVLEADGISIEIPSGTFDNNYEISVSSITDDNSFDGNTISSSYNLKGLPENLNKRIRLAVNYLGELNEETYLAVGSGYLDNISNEESVFYNIFPGIDSSGYIVAYLENNLSLQLPKKSETNDDTEKIIKIINSLRTVSSEHFKITFPTILSTEIIQVGTNLEEAFSTVIDDLGLFNYTDQSDKISVLISKQSEGVKLNLWKLLWDPNSTPDYALNINYELVSSKNFQSIKYNFGIQLIDLWMAIKMKALQSKNWGSSSYQWLKSAILTWSEELFTDESTFESPYNFKYNQMAPFEGLALGAGQFWDTQNKHGHGMASLIKYLDKNYLGNQIVKKTFSTIDNDIAPDLALYKNVDEFLTVWFPDFFKEYLSGNIYELSDDYFYTNAHHSWSINTENDTLKDFNSTEVGKYPDLSAKLFRIDLNYSGFDETQNLLLSMKGPVTEDGLSLVVFGIQNGETIHLETAHAQGIEIPNLKDYYDNNMRQFLVCLVNSLGVPPYEGSSDIDLSIKINDGTPSNSGYKMFSFESTFQGHYSKTNDVDGLSEYDKLLEIPRTVFSGEFVSGEFNGEWNDTSSTSLTNITLKVVLNTTQDLVKSFEYSYASQSLDSEYYNDLFISIFGFDIPLVEENDEMIKFSISLTSDVCNNISSVDYRSKTWYLNEQRTLLDYSCDEFSEIIIQLYNE